MFPLSFLPAALGIGQTLAGAFLSKGPRPSWQIPGAASEALANARTNALATTRPGAAAAEERIRTSSNDALSQVKRSAGSAPEILAAATALNNNTNKALIQDSQQNDQFSYNAKQNLQRTLGNYANFQREKFVNDVWAPYQSRVDTKNALVGSGLQNVFGSLAQAGNMQQQQQYLDYLTANGGRNAGGVYNPFSAYDTSAAEAMLPNIINRPR